MKNRPRSATSAINLHWQETLRVMTEGLVGVGRLYGDDPALMSAKAQRLCELLRTITDQVPRCETHAPLTPGLTRKKRREVIAAIRKALDAGRDAALIHVAAVLMGVAYDLCTSKLAPERRQD